jgi:hypothetical protein
MVGVTFGWFDNPVGNPLVIDVAERLASNARRPEVEVFVDVHVEEGVQIDKCT